ncbi:hypothetical protein N7492_010031 [Penicillium capsulatum]|uniref:FAD-binding PCMH-type domain-containing protein n=1 Tax=Penicillium capsulatum TaxID=69766 RepID=A0A9W9HLN6_9EURO|nr:hypothetical protein N7492_010031 [Penicillium capsulatum]
MAGKHQLFHLCEQFVRATGYYQVNIITSEGHRLVANDEQNQDIFWAIRGAGGGQFGVVTEFVLRTNPVPENVVNSYLTFYARDTSQDSEGATWAALAELASQFPDLMDMGFTGTVDAMTGEMAARYLGLPKAVPGPAVMANLIGFNSNTAHMDRVLRKSVRRLHQVSNGHLNLSFTPPVSQGYWSFSNPKYLPSTFAGLFRFFTDRLLGTA